MVRDMDGRAPRLNGASCTITRGPGNCLIRRRRARNMRAMTSSAGPPLVLGSSLSGLLVSLALSRRGVEHRLVGGDEPASIPRLGESLNDTASPELFRTIWFPSSAGLWTTTAAAGMVGRLLAEPARGAWYERTMRGLLRFHDLLEGMAQGRRGRGWKGWSSTPTRSRSDTPARPIRKSVTLPVKSLYEDLDPRSAGRDATGGRGRW